MTLASNVYKVREALRSADLVIGAVLVPEASAPKMVRRDMVSAMKKGACWWTSRSIRAVTLRPADRQHTQIRFFTSMECCLLRDEYAGGGATYIHFWTY